MAWWMQMCTRCDEDVANETETANIWSHFAYLGLDSKLRATTAAATGWCRRLLIRDLHAPFG
jgi:hypothetical protein